MELTRRSLLRLGAALGTMAAGCRREDPPPAAAATTVAPLRACVVVFLRGGIDAIFTTNPRRAAEVAPGVDVPYAESEIVTAGDVRVGPHLAPLAPSLSRMALLNGVRVHTANHETGAAQILRMRTSVLPAMPSLLDIIGAQRDGRPLACVSLGKLKEHEHSQRWFSEEQLRLLDRTTPEDRHMLAKVMRGQAARLGGGAMHRITRENLEDCASLFERTTTIAPFTVARWNEDPRVTSVAADLQRTLWLLENELTKTVFLKAYLPWDTHERNREGQGTFSPPFFTILQRFLDELAKRRDGRGALSDSVRVVVTSEVGRFPRLNGDGGKDHFPEVPMMFHGPRLATRGGKGATFGITGPNMEALPLDVGTGASGSHFVRLDDVGATLLRSFGIAPERYGYDGRVLDFLETT